jgi:hypothetical protein
MATKSASKTTKKTTSTTSKKDLSNQQDSTLWLFGITLILLGILLVVNLIHAAANTPEMVKGASTLNRPTTVNQELRSIEHILKDADQSDTTNLK